MIIHNNSGLKKWSDSNRHKVTLSHQDTIMLGSEKSYGQTSVLMPMLRMPWRNDNIFTFRIKILSGCEWAKGNHYAEMTLCADEHIAKVKEDGRMENCKPNITCTTRSWQIMSMCMSGEKVTETGSFKSGLHNEDETGVIKIIVNMDKGSVEYL